MKLGDWLKRNGVTRADFARRIGVSPGAVTLICREDRAWLSRETAERIVAETQRRRHAQRFPHRRVQPGAKDTTCIIP